MFEQALQLIEQYDTIVIHRHTSPDGDAIGSQVGLQQLILHNYPSKKVFIVGDETKRYAFMQGSKPDVVDNQTYANALAIVLDTSAKHLIADNRYTLAKATLRIDHHIFCEKICDVEIVDTSYESCCGLVAQCALECGWKHTTLSAKSLFTGMVTDSGRFRYDSTTSRTFTLASTLICYPFDTNEIYAELYADDLKMVQLRAQFALKINIAPNNVAFIKTTKEQLATYDADCFTISRGMVGVMADVRGVDSWVNFTETEQGVLCELRSKKYNINTIAVKYGGGGHAKASGATVPDWQTANQMLNDLCQLANN